MKKTIFYLFIFVAFIRTSLRADEGMWLPFLIGQLNIGEMTEMGFELSAEDIYSVNQACLKDAIVALDNGSCTAELISDNGLLLTNHHCGYEEIQNHSTEQHDYLTEGFWSMSYKEELPNIGKTATFLIRMEDVTEKILQELKPNMTEDERAETIESMGYRIASEAVEGTDYDAQVETFFNENRFYLIVSQTYKDVRLVGAPPESIGKFGHDTDNWMWPRHTGDFSLFRIYTGPNGKPAEYSKDNIPLKPKFHLTISLDGVQKGDFAMVMGYPGSTDRYLTSFGLLETMEIINTNRIKIRGAKQEVWKKDMDTDNKIRIQYASKYARSSNYWKYSIGQNMGLEALNVIEDKRKIEAEFTQWALETPARKEKYGFVLPMLKKAYEKNKKYANTNQYIEECLLWSGSDILWFAFDALNLYFKLGEGDDAEALKTEIEELRTKAKDFFKDFNKETDQKVLNTLLQLYYDNIPKEHYPEFMVQIDKKYKGKIYKFTKHLYKKSIFADPIKLEEFLNAPTFKVLSNDLAFNALHATIVLYRELYHESKDITEKIEKGNRLFLAGLMEMKPDQIFYPDANSTMRVTYGTVGDYSPRDGVQYLYYTTLKGYIEKEDSTNAEFEVSEHLKELYINQDYGNYGVDGTMYVCFTTNNDITGGNSGSPVLNSRGQLIGCAFDGNWEAMSGDIAFEDDLQKCINVDIRFVLFVIDKYAGATRLIDEMTIVKSEPKPEISPIMESSEIVPIEAIPQEKSVEELVPIED